MTKTRKLLMAPILILIFIVERISRPVWTFASSLLMFWILFHVVNSDVEPGNISHAVRVVFWDAVLGLVALQTLPQQFFDIFSGEV
jgi:hypothetical protein